jgi:pyruvate/2-oxoglutarate dehydrogenase complex dihydrolipoamide dehydrogenase (E3) component
MEARMARPEFDLVVIGGGSGGLVIAAGGAALGAKVALVEKHKLGGDCLWSGCVPSKTLIKSARIAHQMRHADRWALASADPHPDLVRVMERVARVIADIEPDDSPERFRSLGIDVIMHSGRFVTPDAFDVGGRTLTATNFVIATGSRPALPPIAGLADVPYLTNETLFGLREPVPHLVVIGAGPIGCEMAQAFRRLGSEVTVVDMSPQILPREDADLAAIVHSALVTEGVRYHLGVTVGGVATGDPAAGRIRVTVRDADGSVAPIVASHLLVAAGRTANIDGLGLDAAGVAVDHGRIVVDEGLSTTNPRVHVIGDAAGGYQFTHVAEHHAGIVLRRTLLHLKWKKPSEVVPWCTYTDPELARVGVSETEARKHGIDHKVYRFPFGDIDRARTEGETEGFAKLVTNPRGKLLGAAIVGAHAGELIAECVLAIGRGMKAADLSASIHAYPTLSQISRRAADQRQKERLTPSAKTWIQRIFHLRGA